EAHERRRAGRASKGEAATIASPASARRRFRRSTPNRYAARHRPTGGTEAGSRRSPIVTASEGPRGCCHIDSTAVIDASDSNRDSNRPVPWRTTTHTESKWSRSVAGSRATPTDCGGLLLEHRVQPNRVDSPIQFTDGYTVGNK